MTQKKKSSQLVFLLLVFIIPLVISYFLYRYHDYFHFKTINHGVLVNPPLPVNYLYSTTKNAASPKWHVIYLAKAPCKQTCKEIIYQLHQVQKALGKNATRVDILTFTHNPAQFARLSAAFPKHFVITNKIYLVDPLGNLFMYYPALTDPLNILKDLKRVLEVSQID